MNRLSYDMLPISPWITYPLTWVTAAWEVSFPLLVLCAGRDYGRFSTASCFTSASSS